jgi:hypothetical protein
LVTVRSANKNYRAIVRDVERAARTDFAEEYLGNTVKEEKGEVISKCGRSNLALARHYRVREW